MLRKLNTAIFNTLCRCFQFQCHFFQDKFPRERSVMSGYWKIHSKSVTIKVQPSLFKWKVKIKFLVMLSSIYISYACKYCKCVEFRENKQKSPRGCVCCLSVLVYRDSFSLTYSDVARGLTLISAA